MTRKTVTKRAKTVAKRYGNTTKGTARKKPGKTTIRPKRIGGNVGIRVKKTF